MDCVCLQALYNTLLPVKWTKETKEPPELKGKLKYVTGISMLAHRTTGADSLHCFRTYQRKAIAWMLEREQKNAPQITTEM